MQIWNTLIEYLYTITLGGMALYAMYISALILLYLWHRRDPLPQLVEVAEEKLPYVTIQLPLRNERYVVQRLLNTVAAFDWPADRLEIQVLDDSDDDTTTLVQTEIQRLREQGVNIRLLHRTHPTGHKAGALDAGLKLSHGEFVAIFDADFVPPADFLRRTIPYFLADETLGMLQTRWGHLNYDYSLITRAQALVLDAHFTVEHLARNRSGLLMNFNGTAGVWRVAAINQAGGWQSDTLTEDLDLSLRAQMAGWHALYLPNVVCPAEIPPLAVAFKQQQYRWAKGAAQVLRKLTRPLLKSPQLTWPQKLMALLQLSAYLTQPLFLMMIILSLPMMLYHPHLPGIIPFLGAVSSIPPLLYILGQIELYRDWPKRILAYPTLMLLGVGLSWSCTLALLDGFFNWGGEFVRTPKFRLEGQTGRWRMRRYRLQRDRATRGEIFIGLYALATLWLSIYLRQWPVAVYSFIYALGEGLMVISLLRQAPLEQVFRPHIRYVKSHKERPVT